MMRNYLLLALFVLSGIALNAQCEKCTEVSGRLKDHCYTDASFPDLCVQFSQDEKTLIFEDKGRKKNNLMELPLPEGCAIPDIHFLTSYQNDKKLKLSARDLLFIERAILSWREIEGIRKWDNSIVNSGMSVLPSGLSFKKIAPGDGDKPSNGSRVRVHYTGYLVNGNKFDSSLDRKQTFEFVLGKGQVIKGWEEGIALMEIGSRYLFRIPPDLGYGSRGAGNVIPPNAVLYFDVMLITAE